jgi:hypothetical protein
LTIAVKVTTVPGTILAVRGLAFAVVGANGEAPAAGLAVNVSVPA